MTAASATMEAAAFATVKAAFTVKAAAHSTPAIKAPELKAPRSAPAPV